MHGPRFTLACALLAATAVHTAPQVELIARGLSNPRGIAFVPNGQLFVTEAGRGRRVRRARAARHFVCRRGQRQDGDRAGGRRCPRKDLGAKASLLEQVLNVDKAGMGSGSRPILPLSKRPTIPSPAVPTATRMASSPWRRITWLPMRVRMPCSGSRPTARSRP